jgi:RHS repeat-associated protein
MAEGSQERCTSQDGYTFVTNNEYRGFLKSISTPKTTTYFYYPKKESHYTDIHAKLIRTDGSIIDTSFSHWEFQNQPIQTKIKFNSNSDSITVFTMYKNNELISEVDKNGYYNEYTYDQIGRITKVGLPGSFRTSISENYYIETEGKILPSSKNLIIDENNDIWEDLKYDDYPIQAYTDLVNINSVGTPIVNGPNDPYVPINPQGNIAFYTFLSEPYEPFLADSVEYANLVYQMTEYSSSHPLIVLSNTFTIEAITEPYLVNKTSYVTNGSILTSFITGYTEDLDVLSLITELKNQNLTLYGFKFSTIINNPPAAEISYKTFNFDENNPPYFKFQQTYLKLDESKSEGSVIYTYNDDDNIINMNINVLHDPVIEYQQFKQKYSFDGFGKIRKTERITDNSIFETTSETDYNYLGLASRQTDAEGRNVYNKYDLFSRPTETRFVADDPTSDRTTVTYNHQATNDYFQRSTSTDEEGNYLVSYFDIVGNKTKELREISPGNVATTYFTYDDLYRLTQVTTPEGMITTYQYDARNDMVQKTTVDEGTVKYKYDKFGNLRFSYKVDAPSGDQRIVFSTYDDLDRPVITGSYLTVNNFDALDGDKDYSATQSTIAPFEDYNTDTDKFLVVNQYDGYEASGIFTGLSLPVSESYLNAQNQKGALTATAFRDELGQTWSYKLYAYDHRGRVVEYWVKFQDNDWKKISNEYDNLNNLLHQKVAGDIYFWYEYDVQGRMVKVYSHNSDNKSAATLEAEYEYNKADQVDKLWLRNINKNVTYTYNARGWLERVARGFNFRQDLTYLKNGNVSSQLFKNKANTSWADMTFNYTYDGLNRLISSSTTQTSYNETYEYNKDGDFYKKIKGGLETIYDRELGTHKLYQTRKEIAQNTSGYNGLYAGGGTQYNTIDVNYNEIGNLDSDASRNITAISYNYNNLPLSVNKGPSVQYLYRYDDTGQRIYKKAAGEKEYYLRDQTGRELAIYNQYTGTIKMANIFGNGLIGRIEVNYDSTWTGGGGTSSATSRRAALLGNWHITRGDTRYYYVKDHLGSIRQTWKENGTIVNGQDYYPFGEVLRQYTVSDPIEKYKFTEKERDKETGYDYFGARYYDPQIGRFLSVDPHAYRYPSLTPYNYVGNNPLNFIDPSGMDSTSSKKIENDDIVTIDGVDIAYGLVDNLYSSGFFTAEAISTAVNNSTNGSKNKNSESDKITPVPPSGVKIGSWNRLQSRAALPSVVKEFSWLDNAFGFFMGIGRLVTNENGMPMVTPQGINLPAVGSRYIQGTKSLYFRNADKFNDFGAGVLDAATYGYPEIRPTIYYGAPYVGYQTYKYIKKH